MSEIPDPDPNAPSCAVCEANGRRQAIFLVRKQMNAVLVSEGIFYDSDGRKHEHYGTAGGQDVYKCECGHVWKAAFSKTLFPCWCGWGATT